MILSVIYHRQKHLNKIRNLFDVYVTTIYVLGFIYGRMIGRYE
jgi:hypothetical protein